MEVKVPQEKPLLTAETLTTAAAPAKIALEHSSTEAAALTSADSSLPSPTAAAAAAVMDTSGAETDLQKKLRRAERFGMPVKLSEEEKRNSRAERFGTAPISHGKSEEEKRKARAERFGTSGKSTSDEEAKKKARLDRFGTASKASSVEEEKMKARALRFSESNPVVPSHTNGRSDPGEENPGMDKSSKKT